MRITSLGHFCYGRKGKDLVNERVLFKQGSI